MSEFALQSSTSNPITPASEPSPSSGSSSATFDHSLQDDVCSICLESFSVDDPAAVTSCKHEYHLQCILEWSQRSNECPICWQSLVMMDPGSQKLLAAAEVERKSRARRNNLSYSLQNSNYEPHYTGGSDLPDHIMQQVAAAMSRTRHIHRSQQRRIVETGPSHVQPIQRLRQRSNVQQMHHSSAEDELHSADWSSGGQASLIDRRPSLSQNPQIFCMPGGTGSDQDGHVTSRSSLRRTVPNDNLGTKAPDLLAFSESIKSKLSAASARYKDSISKGTQGFRERVRAHNTSVKELSKEVQREMSASISGFAKMIERLDLKSKRSSSVGNGSGHVERDFGVFSKGKQLQEHLLCEPADEDNVNIVQSWDVEKSSSATCSNGSPQEVSYSKGGN